MTHPILTAAATMGEVLKTVADTNPTFMTTSDKADALRELVRVESRLVELRLRMLADADDVAALTASRDAAGWLANETRVRWEDARSDVVLARGLDRRWTVLATAMREGRTTLAQARVISRALDELPSDASAEVVDRAEATLVDYAERFEPRQLARLGRKILDVVAPEIAEEAEARRLAALEEEATRRTRLTMRRLGDGTTRISGRLPDAAATRLATYLEAFTSPRQLRDDEADSSAADSDPFTRLPYPRRLGEAFIQFLESLDPRRLPLHGGDATTVVVTVPLAALRRELGAADLWGGSVPGRRASGRPSLPPRRDASRARRRSSRPCWAAPPRSSTWAARVASSLRPSVARFSFGIAPAALTAVTSPAPGPMPTTGCRGPRAEPPISTTQCFSAAITTIASMTPPSPPSAWPMAM